jgi:hypothetical protein
MENYYLNVLILVILEVGEVQVWDVQEVPAAQWAIKGR